MIAYDAELQLTLDRLARLQAQVSHLRKVETNAADNRKFGFGFIA